MSPDLISNLDLDLFQVSFLALVQGLTEFLPISSSAHLILPSELLGWPDQGLSFDVAVHVGTLLAVIVYFRADIKRLFLAWVSSLGGSHTQDSRLAWLILLATVPGGIAGLLLEDFVEQYARSMLVIAVTSLIFAALLFWSDKSGSRQLKLSNLGWKGALLIGLAQALALIPGTSRSGITMTAALFCGLDRQAAARFSFLLAIPIILAGGLFESAELVQQGSGAVQWFVLLYASALSALVAFACIHYFLKLIEKTGFMPFVIYRFGLGIFLLILTFS